MPSEPRIAIVGAGPTGIGAGYRLNELGHSDWALYEASEGPGGLASSVLDDEGFTWDLGGHVLFSHYEYFDDLMKVALGDRWVEHIREAWVWMRERWIPYPFQNNLWRLPEEELIHCLEGLVEVIESRGDDSVDSFRDWLSSSFGRGLCETFMYPYNEKVWAYPPSEMDVGWMGERVARVDFARVLRNVVLRKDDVAWGPNSLFRFPESGGTGSIWKSLYEKLPAEKIQFNRVVEGCDLGNRKLFFNDGTSEQYDYLISTRPLDQLLLGLTDRPELKLQAKEFVHSSSHIVGVGMQGQPSDALKTKCWMYFPEPEVPFYRVTVFSNYSPNNVPDASTHWSLMAEVSESPHKPVDAQRVVEEVVTGLKKCGLITPDDIVRSEWHRRLEYGYPTPWLGRDEILAPIDAELTQTNVFSRGRFGGWKYEVSNQDHSLMQGVEAVDQILSDVPERTYTGDMSDEIKPIR